MHEIWNDWTLDLTVNEVLRGQGIDPEAAARRRPALIEAAAWAVQEGLPLLTPQVLVRQIEVREVRHARLLLENGARLDGELPATHLGGAQAIVFMLATLGGALESVAAEVIDSEPALGIAMEGLGVAAIEKLATLAANRVEAQVRARGWHSSIPLSPGMTGWPPERGQPQLLALLDPSQVGVQVNASFAMTPRMSITQAVGLGPHPLAQGCACDYCALSGVCQYRQAT